MRLRLVRSRLRRRGGARTTRFGWGLLLWFVVLGLHGGIAHAENRLTVRGNYYREASTRVLAPELRFTVDAPDERFMLGGGYLLDVVSSASIATGTADATGGDNVFTELRHETSGFVASRLGPWQLNAGTRYSTETDYIGRNVHAGFRRDFLQRTLNLPLTYAYTFDR